MPKGGGPCRFKEQPSGKRGMICERFPHTDQWRTSMFGAGPGAENRRGCLCSSTLPKRACIFQPVAQLLLQFFLGRQVQIKNFALRTTSRAYFHGLSKFAVQDLAGIHKHESRGLQEFYVPKNNRQLL
jgi:hypothetical protein